MLVLIQSEWCPYSKRKFRHAKKHQVCSHTEVRPREDTGRKWPSESQGEWSQEKKKKKNTLPTPYSWNLASEIMRRYITVTSLPVVFVMAALGNSYNHMC